MIHECATLSRVRILCAASIRLSKRVAGTLVELPLRLAGGDCRLFFERAPNRTQHVTIIFNVNQILYPNQVILLLLQVLFFVATKLQKRNKNTTCHKLLSNQI